MLVSNQLKERFCVCNYISRIIIPKYCKAEYYLFLASIIAVFAKK